KLVRVLEGDITAGIGGAQTGIVKGGAVLRGGVSLDAIDVGAFQREILEIDGAEETTGAVFVQIVRDAVVLRGRVEFLVKQILLAVAIVQGAGEQELQAIGE